MRRVALVLVFGLGLACSNKISGDVTLDNSPFTFKSCRSGQAFGFYGVDLQDRDGRRLRLVVLPSGEPSLFYFASGAATGVDLGACGTVSVVQQSSTINDIRNVMGKASLACTKGGHTVKGTVVFENCH
jgi:hypothetical protein